jgi:hypothetical protein
MLATVVTVPRWPKPSRPERDAVAAEAQSLLLPAQMSAVWSTG